jgi:hypothetical protein
MAIDEAEIDRLSTPRDVFCNFCGKKTSLWSDSPQPVCDPECIRAQKMTAAMESLTKALAAFTADSPKQRR